MAPVLHSLQDAAARAIDPAETSPGTAVPALSAQIPPVPNLPLTPLEQEILTACLESPEDPREIGILPALLSAEQRGPRTLSPT